MSLSTNGGARYGRCATWVEQARSAGALPTGVVYPCSRDALAGALEARDAGLIDPVLIGPQAAIRAIAERESRDLAGCTLVNVDEPVDAARHAAQLAHEGTVSVLMKGSLHTDELMGVVVARGSGLRTGRRISHVFVMDVPTHDRPLLVTDAAINIAPSLPVKADIVRNAIDIAHALGIGLPKVALLSAVETVNGAIPSTLDAAALTEMTARGEITGAVVDGPLAFDNAISAAAAEIKGIKSPVSGDVDILVVPGLEAGNILYKALVYLANALAAGVVAGASVPIILTSRADSPASRTVSAAVACLRARYTGQ
jgi:phosphate acetyltransferase